MNIGIRTKQQTETLFCVGAFLTIVGCVLSILGSALHVIPYVKGSYLILLSGTWLLIAVGKSKFRDIYAEGQDLLPLWPSWMSRGLSLPFFKLQESRVWLWAYAFFTGVGLFAEVQAIFLGVPFHPHP